MCILCTVLFQKSHSSRKKLKTSKITSVEECIALGTITGDIMLYDATNNELFCKYVSNSKHGFITFINIKINKK